MKLSTELVNAILQYLSHKPYAEVVGIMAEMQKQINESKEDKLQVVEE